MVHQLDRYENVTSVAMLILALWSIGKYHPRSVIVLVLYRHLEDNMINLTYSLTVNFLVLVVLDTLHSSPSCKVPSIMPANLNCSTEIQSIDSYVAKQSKDMSLVLVARLVEI